jgi:hypothetical protein
MKRNSLIIAVICGLALPAIVLGQVYKDWEAATTQPPGNNPLGPVWLQTAAPTQQTGAISISGNGNVGGDVFVGMDIYKTPSRAIRVDGSGATEYNIGNWGSGANGFKFNVVGNLDVLGFAGTGLDAKITTYETCFTADTCRTTWPDASGVTDVWVDTTGDIMTGVLNIIISDSGKGINVSNLPNTGGGGITVLRDATGYVFDAPAIDARSYGGPLSIGVYAEGTSRGVKSILTGDSGIAVDGQAMGSGGTAINGAASGVDSFGGFFTNIDGVGLVAKTNTGLAGLTGGWGTGGGTIYGDNRGYIGTENWAGQFYGDNGIYVEAVGVAGDFWGDVGVSSLGTTIGGEFFGNTVGLIGQDSDSGIYGLIGYDSYSFFGNGAILGETLHVGDDEFFFRDAEDVIGTYSELRAYDDIDLVDGQLKNTRAIQMKDWDDDTGGDAATDKYRLLARDGAWQFYNGGVVVGNYNNATWTDLTDGYLIVEKRIGVGVTSPVTMFDGYLGGSYNWMARFGNSDTLCTLRADSTYTCTSDARKKRNIETLSYGLDEIVKLRPVSYQWKNQEYDGNNWGFVAQDVMEVMPELVYEQEDGYYGLNDDSILPVLVNAVKELKVENDELRSRVEALEAK